MEKTTKNLPNEINKAINQYLLEQDIDVKALLDEMIEDGYITLENI